VPSFAFTLAIFSLLIWLVLTFFWGGFWQLHGFLEGSGRPNPGLSLPSVAAVVPARDEAETIARCVKSLCAQNYAGEFRVIVVDDHSEDNTAALATEAAIQAEAEQRVEVLRGESLPPGWTGKLWALQQGIAAADVAANSPDFFWFTDADIVHAPDTLARLVARAVREQRDLVSYMVMLHAKTVPERLLIPAFVYFFLMLYPPKWTAHVNAKTAGAAGGCVLVRREMLERIGGIAAIRHEVIDDCALAGAVKRVGGNVWLGLTRDSVSLRAYCSFAEIRDLITRTAFTQLNYSIWLLAGTLIGLVVTYVVPVALSFDTQGLVWRVSLTAWALMTVTYLPTIRLYRLSPLWAPLLPLAAVFYCYATFLSAVRFWMGRGGQWKGRAQAPGGQS